MSPQALIAFQGAVQVRRDAAGPLNLTLIGRPLADSAQTAYLAFANASEVGLPPALENVTVARMDGQSYRISAHGREWLLSARNAHLHRDVTSEFYAAVPPRAPPRSKQLFWRLVLGIAATPLGRAWLARRVR